jgi:hypothetical protein
MAEERQHETGRPDATELQNKWKYNMHESLNSQKITGLYTNNIVCSIQESHSKFSTAIKQTNLFGESTNTGTGPQEATRPKM